MSHSQPSSTASRAQERIENLKSALDWIGACLGTDESYLSGFEDMSEALASRRSSVSPQATPASFSLVHFSAIGKSGDVARLLSAMLNSVGIRASFLHPTEALHGDLGSVRPGDLVVFVSNRGESTELLELLPLMKQRKAEVMALTANARSPLAKGCDKVLLLPHVRELCAHDHAPISSTVITLALGQLLVASTMDGGKLDLETYAHNHPGGAIGKRIFVKVRDVMVPATELPCVSPESDFTTTISSMTEGAVGTVFVVDKHKLWGIITERDLREAMKSKGPAIFQSHAREYANQSPVTIGEDELAVEALRLMELRDRPFNFLPVITDSGEPRGLIRLHDLIKAGIRL